jgi:ABC-type multidrug transport system permease subunit
MSRWRPLGQLIIARIREFYREPEAIFWVYGFPLILALGLGIAFASREPEPPQVDVQTGSASTERVDQVMAVLKKKLTVEKHDKEECRRRLTTGKTALVVVPTPRNVRYEYDPTRAESVLARHWAQELLLADRHRAPEAKAELITTPGSRYIDFLMPGLLGLNLMGGGLWGVGFVTVDMRVRKLLKRYLATPMRRSDFLLSILGSRLIFMIPEMLVLISVAYFGFGVPINGGLLTLLVIVVTGSAAFAGLGLFIACRAQKTETISGLMNLVMLPMWLLSGTFFSSKRFPEVSQPFIQALPLTQLNDALREVMLEGAGLDQVAWRIGILAAWAVVCFALALRWFRWQ